MGHWSVVIAISVVAVAADSRNWDETMKPITTFRTAVAGTRDYLCLSGAMDAFEDSERYTRVITYDELDEHTWSFHEENHIVTSIAIWRQSKDSPRFFVTLGEDGDIGFMDSDEHTEKIPGAGVNSEDAKGWGYMSALKQIGDHLYACGGAGQVYKRLGPGQWVHMDDGLLQEPDVADRLLPRAIDGPHENAIYLVGSLAAMGHPPRAYFWNGQHWRQLELPPVAERITNIYVESEDRIWLCGANGTLLRGNAEGGFKSLSTTNDNQLFYSLCKFQGKIYLGSNLGLFVYDPNNHAAGISEVATGLTPELQDANIVDSVDGVLWSIGSKDIARFDGQKWERIHHPDNPRIGA